MKKTLKILGVLAALLGFAFTGLTIYSLVVVVLNADGGGEILTLVTTLIPEIIAIPFAFMEFRDGIDLLKIVKEGREDKLVRPIAQLSISIIGSILSGALATFSMSFINAITNSGSFSLFEDKELIIGLALLIIGFSFTGVFKSNAHLPLAIVSIIYSIVGLIYAYKINYIYADTKIDEIANIINLVILLLVLIFSLIFIVYYAKHKTAFDIEYEKELDYDVIKEYKSGIAKVKVYQERYGKGGKFTKAIILLGCALFAVFIGFAINETVPDLALDIFNFSNFSPASIGSIFDVGSIFAVIITIPYLIIVTFSLLRNNSTLYSYLVAFISRSIFYITISLSMLTSIIAGNLEFLMKYGYVIAIPFVLAVVMGVLAKNYFSKLNDGLKKGDSFLSLGEYASKSAVFYCLYSIMFTLPYIFLNILNNKPIGLSVYFFLGSILLMTLGIVRNKKHNMEESFVTFHSLKVAKNSAKVDEKIVVESSKEFTQKLEENVQENAKIEEKTNKRKFAKKAILVLVFIAIILIIYFTKIR